MCVAFALNSFVGSQSIVVKISSAYAQYSVEPTQLLQDVLKEGLALMKSTPPPAASELVMEELSWCVQNIVLVCSCRSFSFLK